LIFKPLDRAALEGICGKLVARTRELWRQKREKHVKVPDSLVQYIAARSHEEDRKSGYREGGRIVSKLLAELIEGSIQREAARRSKEYEDATDIELVFLRPGETSPYQPAAEPAVDVLFHARLPATHSDRVAAIAADLRQALDRAESPGAIGELLSESLGQLEAIHAAPATDAVAACLQRLRESRSELDALLRRADEQVRTLIDRCIAGLESLQKETTV
jgi:hypothetical protein